MHMRIAIDGTALYGRFGGVEYALWHLLKALSQQDSDNAFTVFIPHNGPARGQLEQFGPRWRWKRLPFRGERKLRRIYWQQVELPRRLRRGGYALLHAPTYVAPLRSPVTVVLTVYDTIALDDPEFATAANRLHYGQLLPRSIARAAGVIVPAIEVAEAVARHVPAARERIEVIPLGVEDEFFADVTTARRQEIRARYHLPDRYLLFVGNFEPKKNLDAVLQAALQVTPRLPLVLVGGARAWGGTLPQSESAALTLQNLGYVPRTDLPALYAMSSALVWPSLAEGFGLPVLEALAVGTPVVASAAVNLPGLERVALLCDPRDPASIAAQTQRIIADDACADKLRTAGRAYARDYTWQAAARRTLAVYDAVREEYAGINPAGTRRETHSS